MSEGWQQCTRVLGKFRLQQRLLEREMTTDNMNNNGNVKNNLMKTAQSRRRQRLDFRYLAAICRAVIEQRVRAFAYPRTRRLMTSLRALLQVNSTGLRANDVTG